MNRIATTKSGAFVKKYSNEDTVGLSFGTIDINSILNSLGTTASNIWGTGDKYMVQAYQKMYDQQQKTNTVLWVVIGLVVALGVVLIIRKSK